MDEENPLLTCSTIGRTSEDKSQYCNSKGRPKIIDIIKFSPQPQSVISQMLNKQKSKLNHKTIRTELHFIENANSDDGENADIISVEDNDGCNVDVKSIDHEIDYTDSDNTLELNVNKKPYNELKFDCQFCSYRSSNSKDHRIHLKLHNKDKKYFCDYPNCSYVSKLSSNLTKHKRVHTGEKPFFCDICAFRTNFINSLKVHKRTHTMERPYPCKHCSYRANSSSNLKKHCHHKHLDKIN